MSIKDCENIEYSVITTSFIVPSFCENFKLSIDICLELRKKIPEPKIQKILGNINEMGLSKDDISYKYLENLLKKMDFVPISMAKINNTNVISKIIYYMDKYFINTCIVSDSTKSEKYIEEMLNFSRTQKIKPLMKHLSSELINEILGQYDLIDDEEITIDILKSKCPSIPKKDFGEKTLLKYQEQYSNDSIGVIAHYLTENEIRKLNIDSYNPQSVILNNNNYQIVQKESLLVNLIYISIYENINKSIAKEFQIVNEIFKVMNPTTPQQMLRKDIILYLSTINSSKMKQNMKDIIKQAVNDVWSANNLKVNNLSLHILYNEDSRKRMIQYLNDTKDFQSFQKQTKNYSKEDELENIRNNIQLISNNIKSTISIIESNFKYLLDHETRNNQLYKDGINKKNHKKYMEKIEALAKMILKPVDSNFEGSCIRIIDEGESFIQRFKSIRDISFFSKMIAKGKEYFNCDINIYSEESLQYMPTSICPNYDTFYKCDNAIRFYQDINKNFNDIKSTISGNFHVSKLINTIGSFKKQFKKYVNIDITTLCDEIIKSLKKMESMEKIINSFKVRQEPHLPTIDFYPIDEPFKNISYILMIGYKEGKVQLLNEINYDLGDCYANSILKLSISNLTKCSIKTSPPTQINQIGDNIILSMKIDKESQEIELLNNQDNSKIGIIKFTCNFVAPNIYLVFSTPITIDKGTIYIRDTIFDQLNISLFSNSSIMSHILKLDTQSGSEICESDVDIINTNSKILFVFHSPGKFRAKMLITFSVINLIISSEIDVFVKLSNHTFIYDCKTNRECQLSERLPYPSYFLVKSPQVPTCTDCELYPEFKKPYLHLVYVNTRSNIKTITNTVNFSFKPSYYNIINDNYIVPKLSDFTPTIPNSYYSRYFEQSNDCVYLKEYYCSDVIVNFKFTNNNKLESLVFRTVFYSTKNYSRDGILINNYDYMNNQIDLIITQINNSQNIFIDKNKNRVIPWINILRLFEKSKNDNVKSFAHKIPDNLILRKDQTYYVVANSSSIKPCYSIPELNINKSIKQNIRNTIEVDTKSYLSLIDLNCSDLYNILDKMKTIKSGMQLYKQIYNSNIEIASIISTVYRTLKFLKGRGIMENTIDEIISVGNKLFEDKYHSKNIEIILDSSKTESFENINFKYYKTKNDSHDVKIQETDESSDNEKTEHSYNSFVVSKSISDLKDKEILNNFVQIFSNDNNKSMNNDKKPAQQNIKTDKPIMNNETSNIIAASIDLKATKFDESQSPRNAYNRAYSPNPKLYDFSNIERDNKNLFLPNTNLIEGKIPELDHYIFNIFALLIKSNFTLSLPKNHVTIMIDISVLSGKDNKNLVATNIMVSLQLLAAFDIQFSVWMFADRNLCFCVKKPTDIFDKKRQSIIRDAYFLDRRNPDSYLLSAIDTVSRQGFEKTSSLYIIFSTFVSSQVLTPFFKWDEKALNCLNNKIMIGFVEPCQYIEKDISNRLKDVLKESDFTHYITFTDIIISVKDLLLKIFQICKYNSRDLQTSSEATLNISLHKFMNEPKIKHNSEFYVFKNMINVKKTKNSYHPKTKKLNVTKIEGKFETIDTSEMNFGDSNYSTIIMYPNKATRYELTSHGYIIDIQGLINSYFSNFSNMNIFKQKTGEKIREYSVSILIDASTIIRQYSIDHCFLSAISILSSIKELEIPYVNLSIAGKHIISLLVDQDLRYIPHTDAIYSKLYSTLIEEASETRSLVTGLQQIISHTLTDSIPNILFIITDALLGTDEENKIKDLLSFAQLNGTTIIGIGTGPTPFRIEDIFSWGVWSPDPYLLRESLNKLMQSSITKNIFKPYDSLPNPECPKEAPKMNEEITNSKILEPFANTEFINICIYESINSDAFDQSKLTGDFINKKSTEANVDGAYKGYKILVMMFYQGKPNTVDKYITEKVFREGPPNMPSNTKSPGDKFKEKGFDYKIVTKYKDSLNELLTGTYSIAMVCTASDGTEKGTEDENYLEPFLDAMAKFHQEGGAMILFGENPPYIFEINHILNRLPGIRVRLDEKKSDLGEGIMKASKTEEVKAGEFLAPKFKFAAKINGMICSDLPSLGGGLLNLSEGKTLAIFNNIDSSFKVFSRTTRNNPACIYRVPEGKEGVIFIDSGCSKLFHEYTETGAARYINNLSMGCIHYSNFRTTYHNNLNQEGIKFSINVRPRKPTIMKRQCKPLLLSIMIDATGSMSSIISSCKNKLNELINMCKSKVNQIDISIQFVAYRDICDGSKITEQHGITKSPDSIKNFISNIRAFGGCGWTADIDAGFEAALNQIESTSTNFTNVFILIGDAPNHDPSYSLSSHKSGNKRGERWQTVWNNINSRMSRKSIESLICISCDKEFELQYDIWGAYSCYHIRRIIEKYSITGQMPFESIFVNKISEVVQKIYMT